MEVIKTELPGVLIIRPDVFSDERGYFIETWQSERYKQAGIKHEFVQDNVSFSARGTLRGLHYQHPNQQGKLIQVLSGEVFDVAVDIRPNSPMFGKWIADILSSQNKKQLYVPPGFAHGFCVTSETAVFSYKCTDYYNAKAEGSVRYDDPAIGIDWPDIKMTLSEKDTAAPLLKDIDSQMLPKMGYIKCV